MQNVSMTGAGMLAFIIIIGLKYFGIVGVDDQVMKIATDIIQDGSFVIMIIGQLRRPDLHFGMIRR